MKRSTPAERRDLQRIGCPTCDALVSPVARRCLACGTNFAYGALGGLRTPAHARRTGMAMAWVQRFLRGSRFG